MRLFPNLSDTVSVSDNGFSRPEYRPTPRSAAETRRTKTAELSTRVTKDAVKESIDPATNRLETTTYVLKGKHGRFFFLV